MKETFTCLCQSLEEASTGETPHSESQVAPENLLAPITGLDGFAACASHIGSKNLNEDACRAISIGEWNAIVLADGVGSSIRAYEAAQTAVEVFSNVMADTYSAKKDMPFSVLKECYDKTSKRLVGLASEASSVQPELQTTVIAAIETNDKFYISYLGDGDIWLRRGDGWAIPLMIPHTAGTLLAGGLTGTGMKGSPVFIEYSKSFRSGMMLLAGTDGVFDIEGGINTLMTELVVAIKELVPSTNYDLEMTLAKFLDHMHEKYRFSDNATLGILASINAMSQIIQ